MQIKLSAYVSFRLLNASPHSSTALLKRNVSRYDGLYTFRFIEVMKMRAVTPSSPKNMSRSALYRGAKAGRWERIARGIYLPSDSPPADWDQIEAAARRPDATICLLSALAHYDLTEVIPDALDVAIPRGARTPRTDNAIRWHLFDKPAMWALLNS